MPRMIEGVGMWADVGTKPLSAPHVRARVYDVHTGDPPSCAHVPTLTDPPRSMKGPIVKQHDLDYAEIDDLDEISGDEQLALIWCNTHRKYEWQWVAIDVAQPRRRSRRLLPRQPLD